MFTLNDTHRNMRGFTLIELSVSMIIIGLFIVGAIQAYKTFDEKRKIEIMELRLTDVQQAITAFAELNGRLPCAAPREIPRTNAAFGREVDCTIAAAGTVRADGQNGTKVRIGMLPARTLGIADSYMLDPYHNAFTYAVTEELTDEALYSSTGGGIDVLDTTNTSLFTDTVYAQYILVSAGENGQGAYSYDGVLAEDCNTDNAEGENCNDDAVFKETSFVGTNSNDYYDDRILYKNRVIASSSSGEGNCEQQDSFTTTASTCPDGWEKISLPSPFSYGRKATITTPPQHYNVDPETGEYYFTKGKAVSSETELQASANPIAQATTFCTKKESNKKTTKCFNQKITLGTTMASGGGGFGGGAPAINTDSPCPEGWSILSTVQSKSSVGYLTNNYTIGSGPAIAASSSVTCGR